MKASMYQRMEGRISLERENTHKWTYSHKWSRKKPFKFEHEFTHDRQTHGRVVRFQSSHTPVEIHARTRCYIRGYGWTGSWPQTLTESRLDEVGEETVISYFPNFRYDDERCPFQTGIRYCLHVVASCIFVLAVCHCNCGAPWFPVLLVLFYSFLRRA